MPTAQQAPGPEFATAYRDMMLQSILMEAQTTRKVIAAVPDGQRDYRPDPKARTAWELAWHLASTDVQFLEEIAEGKFSMEPRFKDGPKNIAEMADWYESGITKAADKVRVLDGETLMKQINFFGAFNLSTYVYLSFLEKHSIHHRGQLSAYLRPMGSKVPSIYGGSADEEWKGQVA